MNNILKFRILAPIALTCLSALPVCAANVFPDLTSGPIGWSPDRYAPASFSNVGTVDGLDNVLGLSISSAQDSANRAGTGQSATFYNTQGDQHAITGGPGDDVAIQLFIPESWSSNANGDVRTDLWVDTTAQTDFGILGFRNFGTNNLAGATNATFQGYDNTAGTWRDLSAPVLYDQWNTLDIQYTGTAWNYVINGVVAETVSDLAGSNNPLQTVFLEAYNFGDPNFCASYGGSGCTAPNNPANYTALYANVTPEPSTWLMLASGGIMMAFFFVRRKRTA